MIIDCSLWSMFQILLIYSFEYEFNSGNQICLAYADDTWCWLIPLFWIFENFPGPHERTHIGLIIFTISELLILPFVVVYSNSFNIERSGEEWFENLGSYKLKSDYNLIMKNSIDFKTNLRICNELELKLKSRFLGDLWW